MHASLFEWFFWWVAALFGISNLSSVLVPDGVQVLVSVSAVPSLSLTWGQRQVKERERPRGDVWFEEPGSSHRRYEPPRGPRVRDEGAPTSQCFCGWRSLLLRGVKRGKHLPQLRWDKKLLPVVSLSLCVSEEQPEASRLHTLVRNISWIYEEHTHPVSGKKCSLVY